MKQIKIDYKGYELDNETAKQLRKADMCQQEIAKRRPFEGEMPMPAGIPISSGA